VARTVAASPPDRADSHPKGGRLEPSDQLCPAGDERRDAPHADREERCDAGSRRPTKIAAIMTNNAAGPDGVWAQDERSRDDSFAFAARPDGIQPNRERYGAQDQHGAARRGADHQDEDGGKHGHERRQLGELAAMAEVVEGRAVGVRGGRRIGYRG
jgi:hypothetical protein